MKCPACQSALLLFGEGVTVCPACGELLVMGPDTVRVLTFHEELYLPAPAHDFLRGIRTLVLGRQEGP